MGRNVDGNKKLRWLRISEICVLLMNLLEASRRPDIGFEDADHLLVDFLREMDRFVKTKDEHIQSLLWSANLLNERGDFWHPGDMSFDDFVRNILTGATFNREYNLIKRNDEQ